MDTDNAIDRDAETKSVQELGKGSDKAVDKEVDARGLNCPLPILKAKKALADMSSGKILRVIATDAGSMRDFQAFARQTGNELIDQVSENEEFVHLLRRR